ncbi:probable methyltransferase-like protein 25 [Montipora foliosa]|uniref:probable methyltransferase-like protein 25 n=1 Tax=Montipora foliosa TaxID=591990 RepID=UPI0035F120F6
MDAHMVDFFTLDHWESILPQQTREDLELLASEQVQIVSLPNAFDQKSEIVKNCGESLRQFLTEAAQAQLKSFSWLRERQDFLSNCRVNFISHIMAPKKSYEVEIMSNVINTLATQFQVSKILDLGSGKGYLSQNLALQHGLKVIGVDSSPGNTENAYKRNEKLLKAWKGLVNKSQHQVGQLSCHKSSEKSLTYGQNSSEPCSKSACCNSMFHDSNVGINSNDTSAVERKFGTVCKNCADVNQLQETISGESEPLLSQHTKYSTNQNKLKQKEDLRHVTSSFEPSNRKSLNDFSSLSGQLNKEACGKCSCRNLQQNHCLCTQMQLGLKDSAIASSSQLNTLNPNSFFPVTGFVDHSFVANGELRKLFDQLESSDGECHSESNGMFLVGLHACGDLVPMALRIFVNEPSVKLICIVGCCYHLVSQQFGLESNHACSEVGFPMSEFLKPYKCHVSRNATMVAQQAAERIGSQSKCPPPSVLYRAILQVILRDKFGLDGRGLHVGKAGSKCKSFKEYMHKCLIKLGLQDRISELSDEELDSYEDRFKSREKQLHAFHQLRATIAPCIESVFLLDRLCYLHEQGFASASIVRLFDPVKSPRCYAIIATKA